MRINYYMWIISPYLWIIFEKQVNFVAEDQIGTFCPAFALWRALGGWHFRLEFLEQFVLVQLNYLQQDNYLANWNEFQ